MKRNLLNRNFLSGFFIGSVGFGYLCFWIYLVDKFSVNILFWDQWDFNGYVFEPHSLWEGFSWQHGPHRLGLGLILELLIAKLSRWDTRVICYVIVCITTLSTVFAFLLKKRVSRASPAIHWHDVLIIIIVLTPIQWGLVVNTPNLAHGSLPLLLMMLYCIVLTVGSPVARYSGLLLLNFILIYTGFGLFIGVITPCILLLDGLRFRIYKNVTGLAFSIGSFVISILSIGSFFIDYTFSPAIPDFKFPIPEYWNYFQFMSLQFARPLGFEGSSIVTFIVGYLVFGAMIYLLFQSFYKIYSEIRGESRNDQIYFRNLVIIALIGFTLLFSVNSAIGRAQMGIDFGQSSRYVSYVLLGILGIYFALSEVKLNLIIKNRVIVLILVIIVGATFPFSNKDKELIAWYRNGKMNWKMEYLKTESIEKANAFSGFQIYPIPKHTNLEGKLQFLKENELNLYK